MFVHSNVLSMSSVACAKSLKSGDIWIAFSHWSEGLLSPWKRIRGMPATEESAHADDFVSLPSISATTLLSRMAGAEITII